MKFEIGDVVLYTFTDRGPAPEYTRTRQGIIIDIQENDVTIKFPVYSKITTNINKITRVDRNNWSSGIIDLKNGSSQWRENKNNRKIS